jgi:hypothetical protein
MKNIKTLKFWGEWCKPCTALSVQLEGLEMTSYNIDDKESAAALKKYKIRNIPALVFVEVDEKENEIEIHRHLGMISRQAYLDTVDALTYEKVNPEYQELVASIGSPQEEDEEKVRIYSQVINFEGTSVDSIRYLIGEQQFDVLFGQRSENISDFVRMLNLSPQENGRFNKYGRYFDNGDGRVLLLVPVSILKDIARKYNSNERITLEAFWD